ncbi:arabinose efflux permease family protein [Microvirga lotononidis]|uniref:Arabinose efflux permease family protein n=2 Tax=Microvirga lotononidis TaxID=864069 RepID=I4YR14_9HYPH|nr:arabinose efflux permease family protein [Microvirga lotononidis]
MLKTDSALGRQEARTTCTMRQRRDLAGACLAHTLHDGYSDLIYALLPIWQREFGLSYAGMAIMRVLYFGTMGALQVPGDRWLGVTSARVALALATLVAALGYLVAAVPGGLSVLGIGLALAGIGSSIQHPRASVLVTDAYGDKAKGPLGIYNFAGDLGKAILPALVALLLPILAWRSVVALVALLGLLVAGALLLLIPRQAQAPGFYDAKARKHGGSGKGFTLLLTIGALDSAPRMGYLLFLPFLIHDKGGAEATVGLALALIFIGGALGKAVCGWLGQRLGVVVSVVVTEAATTLLMITTLLLPLDATLVLLPLLGIVLNGTSSVLYGTVPDLAPKGDIGRAFALFYTGVVIMGAVAPIAYGLIADRTSTANGIWASALTAAMIIPLVLALRLALARSADHDQAQV